jgi:hypothetical protein
MPEKQKYFNWLKIRPFGLAIVLLFSIFFTFAYPPSVAYTGPLYFPVIFNSPYTTITLAWDQNSEPDVAGYKIHIGKSSHKYTQVIVLGLTTRYAYSFFRDGTPFFFALTAYNQKGLESSFSNEVLYQ